MFRSAGNNICKRKPKFEKLTYSSFDLILSHSYTNDNLFMKWGFSKITCITTLSYLFVQYTLHYYQPDAHKICNILFDFFVHINIWIKNVIRISLPFRFMIFVVVLPLLQTYLFNTAIGRKPKNVHLAVINDEIADCDYSAYQGCFLDENQTVSLSCLYLEFMQNQTYKFVSI